ncbi:hypothetical protein ACLKA6_000857 [Drosophila palustris]
MVERNLDAASPIVKERERGAIYTCSRRKQPHRADAAGRGIRGLERDRESLDNILGKPFPVNGDLDNNGKRNPAPMRRERSGRPSNKKAQREERESRGERNEIR